MLQYLFENFPFKYGVKKMFKARAFLFNFGFVLLDACSTVNTGFENLVSILLCFSLSLKYSQITLVKSSCDLIVILYFSYQKRKNSS